MADEEAVTVTIKRHRKSGPNFCVRCANSGREVRADWDVKIGDEKTAPMCDTHARYWTAKYGLMEFPGDR